MKKLIILSSIILTALLTSCSSVRVVTNAEDNVDFHAYKTYNFLGWQKTSDPRLSEIDKNRIRDAFKAELKDRGFVYQASNADMNISLYVVLNEKSSVTAYTDYYAAPGYAGFWRYPYGWGGGYAQTTYQENDYLEGTLVMDIFDDSTKKQIWQAIATSTVVENPEKRKITIPKKVASMMTHFPFEVKE